jgi:hypothetical protein
MLEDHIANGDEGGFDGEGEEEPEEAEGDELRVMSPMF